MRNSFPKTPEQRIPIFHVLTKALSVMLFFICLTSSAQNIGINGTGAAPDASAILDVASADKGVLVPRVSIGNALLAAPVTAPATGLLVWNTNAAIANGSGTGFYYWDATRWVTFGGTHNTLDLAYDEGGAGSGRIIVADAGTVEINGTGGLLVDANTTTFSSAGQMLNTDGTNNADIRIGYVGTNAGNVVARGVNSGLQFTSATSLYDGGYGVYGSASHPTNGTINLNTTIGSNNKAVGIGGGIGSSTSFTGSDQDAVAAIFGTTGAHNSSGGTVTGSKLYAGLLQGNGRTFGLWGENSTYMELVPRWQTRDYDAGVIGFYNSAANGGNNGGSIGTADSYMSVEANVTDATTKHLILQTRTNGNVGIGTAGPTAQLSVNGTANKTGGGTWAVFSDARLKENVTDYTEGLDLIKQVRTVNFNYNDKMTEIWGEDEANEGKVYQGVIAQELQKIAPDMVRSVIVPSITPTESGLATTPTKSFLEVDPNKFTYALINAVKEQQTQIDGLKAEKNKTISDFGVASISGSETFVPFSSEFKTKLTNAPIVTVTPINTSTTLIIAKQTTEGFVVKNNGALPATDFNWIAMSKLSESNNRVAKRQTTLQNTLAEKAK